MKSSVYIPEMITKEKSNYLTFVEGKKLKMYSDKMFCVFHDQMMSPDRGW